MQFKPTYQVRNIERGYWTFDIYPGNGHPPLFSVGEVWGNEREARRRAKIALEDELAK